MKRGTLVAGLAGLLLVGFVVVRRTPRPPPRGPALAVRTAPRSIPDDPSVDDRATALAVASLTPAERERLLAAMDNASTRLEATLLPGADDLGEGDPVVELQRSTKKYLPTLNAARSLVRGEWTSKDLSARAISGCDDPSLAKDETCVVLWADDHDGSRARFLAWAPANAAVFTTSTPRECAKALRENIVADASPIALVLLAEDLALRAIPERAALETAAHRLGRALAVTEKKEESHQLDALGRAPPAPGRAVPWLDVNANTVVVVPRLSALTRLGELGAAIDRAPPCRPQRWIHRAGE